jgi:GTP cyclohydrolase I
MKDSSMIRHETDMLATVQGLAPRGRLQEQGTTRIAKMLSAKCHSSGLAVLLEVRHA